MNGREILKLVCEWMDNNNISSHDLGNMSVAELFNQMSKDKNKSNTP